MATLADTIRSLAPLIGEWGASFLNDLKNQVIVDVATTVKKVIGLNLFTHFVISITAVSSVAGIGSLVLNYHGKIDSALLQSLLATFFGLVVVSWGAVWAGKKILISPTPKKQKDPQPGLPEMVIALASAVEASISNSEEKSLQSKRLDRLESAMTLIAESLATEDQNTSVAHFSREARTSQ